MEAPAVPPLIALLGRPNVGKSTLFNRLTGKRQALVAAVPGTTRDRREGEVRHQGYRFRLMDTGGMGFGLEMAFSAEVEAQIAGAVAGVDFIWVLLDGKEGLNPFDAELHRWVLRCGKPYRLVVNKADSPGRRAGLAEFYGLGSDRLQAISAAHGLGIETLLEQTAREVPGMRPAPAAAPDALREAGVAPDASRGPDAAATAMRAPLRVAFLGRPNVGKSSLVNRILGQSRMIVSSTAGTTREAVETPFRFKGRDYVLVDTAGIRRRSRVQEHLEKLGVLHSLGTLDWVQVVVLVVDAGDEVATQDARLANTILEHGRAVVVAMNKWDTLGAGAARAKAAEEAVHERLHFLDFATFVRTSAVDGSGLAALFQELQKAGAQFRREIRTADLNRMVQAAALRSAPPPQGRSPTRVYYGTQVGREPPAFRFFTNHPKQIDEAYSRYFEHQLRHHFGLEGTPLRIDWQDKRREDDPRPAPTGRKTLGKPAARAPARSAGKSPGKPAGRAPGKSTGRTSGKGASQPAGRAPGKSAGTSAGKPAGRAGGKSAGTSAGKPTGRAGGKFASTSAGKPGGRAGGKSTGRTTGQSAGKSAGKPAGRATGKPRLRRSGSGSGTRGG